MRLLLLLLVLLVPAQARAGKLDDVRDAVRDDDEGSSSSSDEDEDEDEWDEDEEVTTSVSQGGAYDVGLRISAEYAFDVAVVHRPGFALVLDTPWPLSIDTGWTFLVEPLPGRIDHLTLGDVNVCFRFVGSERLEIRTGIGARWMLDMGRVDPGFNYTLGILVFPWKYLVISMEGDLGSLGNAFVAHGRLSLGGRIGVLEIFAGYDVLNIGDVLFHGPVAGLQAWF